ncbi:MAG: hypothetical protein KatS3mg108_1798 [Isosphaeraceae bacterium]|jgi:hypothetical protein|nr:MAG: hypothetical protein KatS3mg108_1798 [Isosphaeraceae bacterium]
MRKFAHALFAAVVAAIAAPTVLAAYGDVTGTWTWTTDRNNQSFTTTLKLKQEGDRLTGTISGRNNTETPIEAGQVEGDKISFQVVRTFNGNRMVIRYQGTVQGDRIVGKATFERDGQTRERDWEAKRGS